MAAWSDSDSDDDVPFAQQVANKKVAVEESDSDDNLPLATSPVRTKPVAKTVTPKKSPKKTPKKTPTKAKASEAQSAKATELLELSDFEDSMPLYKVLPSASHHAFSDAANGSVSDEEDVSDDDFMLDTPAESPKPKKKATPKKKVAKKRAREDDFQDEKPAKKKKITTKTEVVTVKDEKTGEMRPETNEEKLARKARVKLEEELPEHKWWLTFDPDKDDDKKWETLEHNGVLFPPPYTPLPPSVKLIYDGKPLDLTPEAEEVASFYARYIETDHVKKPQFRKNFFNDFKAVLNRGRGKSDPHPIKTLGKCDFTNIHSFLMEEREQKKARSKEEKLKEKEANLALQEKYGYAFVNKVREKISNWKTEPPGLFLGRGDHPKAGMLKARIMPNEVTINIGVEAPVPPCPIDGYDWKEVVHNNTVTWLATWRENVNDGTKYVFLAPSSFIKGKADIRKYETARRLKHHIGRIREAYKKQMKSKDLAERQMAMACYFIDRLALRVGNEKGDDEADTVGCCSLRVEHITLLEENQIQFDFLGKDSMRYSNTVTVPKLVYHNMQRFIKGKEPADDLFDRISTSALNSFLKSMMPGLTAKVFRTYNASITLQQELNAMDDEMVTKTVDDKVQFYNRCNREVAILCNHQRSLPKTHNASMEKLDLKVEALKAEKVFLRKRAKAILDGKKVPDSVPADNPAHAIIAKKKLSNDAKVLTNQANKLTERIRKEEIKRVMKDENKNVAMGTSKINYMDPRITAAWCKKVGEHVLFRIFSKSLRSKFPWAMDAPEDFQF